MNGRISQAESPEARLAAVVIALLKSKPEKEWWRLDYADFESALAPYVKRETLNARLEEARAQRLSARDRSVFREQELFSELMRIESQISQSPFEKHNEHDAGTS